MDRQPLTYAQAGVDVEAGDRAVALMRSAVEATHGPRVLGGIGGFAGLWRLAGDPGRSGAPADPVLAAASDGVGTKLLVAQALDRHDTVGIDLVAMVVDDVVVTGAEPLFVLDYLAVGRVDPERVAAIVAGVAEGCRQARCALLGGETAEHPDPHLRPPPGRLARHRGRGPRPVPCHRRRPPRQPPPLPAPRPHRQGRP